MSVTYSLLRVRHPLSEQPIPLLGWTGEPDLPLGPLREVARRLIAALEQLGPVRREDGAGESPARLAFASFAGELEALLWGDPVTHISINRSVPHDFLPIVDALADLRPFALLAGHEKQLLDPEDYRPPQPQSGTPVLLPLPSAEPALGLASWTRCWDVEGPALLDVRPSLAPPDLLIVPLGTSVTALDLGTGSTRWTVSFPNRCMHAVCAGEVIVCAGRHPHCFGLSTRTGETLWQIAIDGEAFNPGIVLVDGSVALPIHCREWLGEVHVLDPAIGITRWRTRHRHAHTMSLAAAGDQLLVGAGDCVYCERLTDGALVGSFRFPSDHTEGGITPPPAGPMASLGDTAVFLNAGALSRRTLPRLDAEEQLLELPFRCGSQGFLSQVADDLLAVGASIGAGEGLLRVYQGPGLHLLYEIRVQGAPSAAGAVTPGCWSCLVSHGERQAELLLVSTRSGEIRCRETLDHETWSHGDVAAGQGWLCAATRRCTHGQYLSRIRAYHAASPGAG